MAHVAAAHMHVDVANVVTGPGRTIPSLSFDNVERISFRKDGIIEVHHENEIHEIDFHNIDDITCVFAPTAVVWTIIGNA